VCGRREQRASLKLQEMKKKDLMDADIATEDKIKQAITGRTAVAAQGAKDLSAFVSAVSQVS
jgi:phage FluMu protein gp41